MKHRSLLFICIPLCLAAPHALAAHDTYSFLDFAACVYHTTENDSLSGNKNYELWAKRAEAMNSSSTSSPWVVFHMNDGARLGICRVTYTLSLKSELTCRPESYGEFPLAGATFTSIRDKGSLVSFRCSAGCRAGVPEVIHDEGYEPADTDHNIELERAQAKFNRVCKKR